LVAISFCRVNWVKEREIPKEDQQSNTMEKDLEKSTDSSVRHEETIPHEVSAGEEEETARLNLQTILAFIVSRRNPP
jgi:hypothetical protein